MTANQWLLILGVLCVAVLAAVAIVKKKPGAAGKLLPFLERMIPLGHPDLKAVAALVEKIEGVAHFDKLAAGQAILDILSGLRGSVWPTSLKSPPPSVVPGASPPAVPLTK